MLENRAQGLSVLDFNWRTADILIADLVLQHRKSGIRGQIVHFFDTLKGHGASRLGNLLIDIQL